MPGRTPTEAVDAFLDPLREALACVARCSVTVSPGGRGNLGQTHMMMLNNGEPVQLLGSISLHSVLHYEIIRLPGRSSQPFKVSTRGYMHTLSVRDGSRELLSAHWHPSGVSAVTFPHWHMGVAALASDGVFTPRAHLRSQRISLEEIVRMCIEDFTCEPQRNDWDEVLTRTERAFREHSSW